MFSIYTQIESLRYFTSDLLVTDLTQISVHVSLRTYERNCIHVFTGVIRPICLRQIVCCILYITLFVTVQLIEIFIANVNITVMTIRYRLCSFTFSQRVLVIFSHWTFCFIFF